ncbi:hypothetical protein [Cetobacterium sp.]|uniref:hypothetical protein n=1 Tax=Cetobacterium sp. TaxID=2071632 RepID=UPI003EE7FD41
MALYNEKMAKNITQITEQETLDFYFKAILEKIEAILGYKLELGERKEFVKGINSEDLYLTSRPIVSIVECLYSGVDITRFVNVKSNRKINIGTNLCPCDEIEIKYISGYSELPINIQMFIFEQIVLAGTKIDEAGLKSYSIKDISYTYISDLDKNKNFIESIINMFGATICL